MPKYHSIAADLVRDDRESLLKFASAFTIARHNPAAVKVNAEQLLKWLNEANGPDDESDRMASLYRAYRNREDDREPDNRPDLLIAEAEVYYVFLKTA
jgi:hypothetical protein